MKLRKNKRKKRNYKKQSNKSAVECLPNLILYSKQAKLPIIKELITYLTENI